MAPSVFVSISKPMPRPLSTTAANSAMISALPRSVALAMGPIRRGLIDRVISSPPQVHVARRDFEAHAVVLQHLRRASALAGHRIVSARSAQHVVARLHTQRDSHLAHAEQIGVEPVAAGPAPRAVVQ